MGRQKGGFIEYALRDIRSAEDIELVFDRVLTPTAAGIGRLPIPKQTHGYCSTDMIITILFYADRIRDMIWDLVFTHFVQPLPVDRTPAVYVEDRYLDMERTPISPDAADKNVRVMRRVSIMLAAGAARVLRILENPHETIRKREEKRRRHESFTETVETHNLAPGELCAILTSAALRFDIPIQKGVQTSLASSNQQVLLDVVRWAVSNINKKFKFNARHRFNSASETLLAMTTTIFQTMSLEDPTVRFNEDDPSNTDSHAVALIRVFDQWYVSDDNVGFLLLLQKPGDPPGKSSVRQAEIDYTFLELIRSPVSGRDETQIVYNLRSTADWSVIVAQTQPITRPGTKAIYIMREASGLFPPKEMIDRPAVRARAPPTSRASGPAAAGAGEPEEMGAIAELLAEDRPRITLSQFIETLPSAEHFREEEGPPVALPLVRREAAEPKRDAAWVFRAIVLNSGRVYVTVQRGPPAGGKRYSRRSKQWGSRKGVGSSTRRKSSRPLKR